MTGASDEEPAPWTILPDSCDSRGAIYHLSMELKGSFTFPAPPESVWALLMDPAVIASCVPGCQALEPNGPDAYRATLTAGVGAITGTYDGVVSIVEKDAPHSYRLLVEGKGRPGFVRGDARIALAPAEGGTRVDVLGNVQVGGLVASVGQRLIGSVSKMMLDKFFGCMSAKVPKRVDGATSGD